MLSVDPAPDGRRRRPTRVRLILARSIPLPADVVFAALVDPATQSRWIIATAVRAADDGLAPGSVGSGLVARTGVGPWGFDDTMRVTEYEPPGRWRVQHTGRVVRGWGQWGVLPDPSDARGSRVYWAEEFEVPFGVAGRLGWAAFGWLVRAGIRLSLARLDGGLRSGSLIAGAGAGAGAARSAIDVTAGAGSGLSRTTGE